MDGSDIFYASHNLKAAGGHWNGILKEKGTSRDKRLHCGKAWKRININWEGFWKDVTKDARIVARRKGAVAAIRAKGDKEDQMCDPADCNRL